MGHYTRNEIIRLSAGSTVVWKNIFNRNLETWTAPHETQHHNLCWKTFTVYSQHCVLTTAQESSSSNNNDNNTFICFNNFSYSPCSSSQSSDLISPLLIVFQCFYEISHLIKLPSNTPLQIRHKQANHSRIV